MPDFPPPRFRQGTMLKAVVQGRFNGSSHGVITLADDGGSTIASIQYQGTDATFERVMPPIDQNTVLDDYDVVRTVPENSVIQDALGVIGEKTASRDWRVVGSSKRVEAHFFALPVTVLKVGMR